MFVQVTRFQHIETQMIHDSLYQHATESTTITREEYYEWIHDLVVYFVHMIIMILVLFKPVN